MDDRSRLEELRAKQRLFELRAKRDGAQTTPQAPEPKMETEKAARAGVSQGVTLGHTPQLAAGGAVGLGKLYDFFQGPVIDPKSGQPIPRVDYTTARDATTAQIDKARKDKPAAFYGGQIAGSVAPGIGMAKGLQWANPNMGRVVEGITGGALLGAASNPGDQAGVVDPVQFKDRAINANLGALIGGTFGAASKLTKGGSEVSKNIKDVKSGAMADRAASTIDNSITQLNQKQLAPKGEELRALIQGNKFDINPDRVETVFPHFAKSLRKRLPEGEARVSLRPNQALRLKRAADAVEDYGASKPFDTAAVSKGEMGKALADIPRHQINADPKAALLNEESRKIMSLRSALAKREGNTPLEILQAKRGSTPAAIVDKVDSLTGSNQLRNLGEDISQAKDLIVDPKVLVDTSQPLKAVGAYLKLGQRGLVEGGAAADRLVPTGTKESLAAALTPTNRKKKKR